MAAKKISPFCFPAIYHEKREQSCLTLVVWWPQAQTRLQGSRLAVPRRDKEEAARVGAGDTQTPIVVSALDWQQEPVRKAWLILSMKFLANAFNAFVFLFLS